MNYQTSSAKQSCLLESTAFALLTLLALLPGLSRGLILDEYKTRMVAALPWNQLIADRLASGHLPTYFSFIKLWTGIFGESEIALRIPGVLLTALAACFMYMFVRSIASVRAARFAALIFAFHQQVVWIGQTARPYSGVLLFILILFWAAAQWWQSGHRRWLIILSLSIVGGVAFMPLAGLGAFALALGTLPAARKHWSKAWPMLLIIILTLTVALLPSLFLASTQTRLGAHNPRSLPDIGKMFDGITNMVYGDYALWARGIMQYISVAVFFVALWLLWRFRKTSLPASCHSPAPWRWWLLVWIFVPMLALSIAGAITGESMVSHLRYRTPALGGVIVLLAVGLDYFLALPWKRPILYSASALILAPVFITTVAWWKQPGEGVREVVSEIIRQEDGVPEQVAGHGRWFRMELPDDLIPARELFLERATTDRNDDFIETAKVPGSDVETMNYNKDSDEIEPIRKRLTQWAQSQPFWLFVYIQRKDALDKVAKSPPDGFVLDKVVRMEDTRAYHFLPTTATVRD